MSLKKKKVLLSLLNSVKTEILTKYTSKAIARKDKAFKTMYSRFQTMRQHKMHHSSSYLTTRAISLYALKWLWQKLLLNPFVRCMPISSTMDTLQHMQIFIGKMVFLYIVFGLRLFYYNMYTIYM